MRSEVHETQLPLHGGNLCDELVYLYLCNSACGEQGIELAFLLKEVGAQAHRLRPHFLTYALGFLTLLCRKLEGFCEVQHMPGTGVMMQLCHLRQPHTAAREVSLDLLGGQRLDLPLLLPNVW
jgi:hypothetical protein